MLWHCPKAYLLGSIDNLWRQSLCSVLASKWCSLMPEKPNNDDRSSSGRNVLLFVVATALVSIDAVKRPRFGRRDVTWNYYYSGAVAVTPVTVLCDTVFSSGKYVDVNIMGEEVRALEFGFVNSAELDYQVGFVVTTTCDLNLMDSCINWSSANICSAGNSCQNW